MRKAKAICFYLPQFHAIEENDQWWGKGFTEWTLVKKAKSLFSGHQQPITPHVDIGYYDLMDPEVRRRQGELAKQYGVYAFCYYHYWFGDKQLLQGPLDAMLKDGEPELPFCLCWANETWTRKWDGLAGEFLIEQSYGDQSEWEVHFQRLLPFFEHNNAVRVDGKILFIIYRPHDVPHLEQRIAYWQQRMRENKLPEIYFCGVVSNFNCDRNIPDYLDASVEHFPGVLAGKLDSLIYGNTRVFSEVNAARKSRLLRKRHASQFPGAYLGWDNTPRRGADAMLHHPAPKRKRVEFLSIQARRAESDLSLPEPFVFINAWNEWGEGACAEPSKELGYQNLDAVSQVFKDRHRPVTLSRHWRIDSRDKNEERVDNDLISVIHRLGITSGNLIFYGASSMLQGSMLADWLAADELSFATNLSALQELAASDAVDLIVVEADSGKLNSCLPLLLAKASPQSLFVVGFYNRNHHVAVKEEYVNGQRRVRDAHGAWRAHLLNRRAAIELLDSQGLQVTNIVDIQDAQQSIERDQNGGFIAHAGGQRYTELSENQASELFISRFFCLAKLKDDGQ